MSGLSVAKSLGHHGQWGFSAGFDMVAALNLTPTDCNLPINILLMQPGDIRHALFTVSRRRRGKMNKAESMRPIHFYLYESSVEVLAREILLLEIINDYEVPIRQRANTFLEVYGNIKVQRRTSLYIEQLGNQLRRLMSKGIGQLDSVLDFTHLRYREKDELENALKAYSRDYAFDMNTLYDHRQRGLYEERYDSRKALFDWDYHGTIKSKASIVHIKQYKEWRNSGIAFEFGDQTYSEPNKTLMSFTEGTMKKGKEKGIKKEVKGFWGDFSSSPYFTFGVDCETPNKHAEGLFEIYNKNTGTEQHRHHAVEIALYNMFSILWESETGQAYRMTKANDIYSGLGAEASILSSKLDTLEGGTTHSDSATTTEEQQQEGDKEDSSLLPIIEAADEDGNEEDEAGEDGPDKQSSDMTEESTVTPGDVNNSQKQSAVDYDFTTPDTDSTTTVNSSTLKATAVDKSSGSESNSSGPNKSASESREKELATAVLRAETIEETYRDVKIFPLTGPSAAVLGKQKYHNFFDCIFVSSRSAQVLGEDYFPSLLRTVNHSAYVAVETGKFLVPLSQSLKDELLNKEIDLADKAGLTQIKPAPVYRRRRDELDKEDDVVFFRRKQ